MDSPTGSFYRGSSTSWSGQARHVTPGRPVPVSTPADAAARVRAVAGRRARRVAGRQGGDVAIGTLFFWWSQRLLLSGRVAWTALLPGAVATMLGLLALRVFSRLVFSPLIPSSAVTYGPFGTVLVIHPWLVGVGVVVFGGALLGRLFAEQLPGRARSVG